MIKANNQIGDNGIKYLSAAKWDNLTYIDLCKHIKTLVNNGITKIGCEHISKAKWSNLTDLNLSTIPQ